MRTVGLHDYNHGNKFPPEPLLGDCWALWDEAMDTIRQAVGLQDRVPDHLPSPESTGYLTRAAEDIASGHIRDDELEDCIEDLREHLKSPYAVQALMGALFCRWLFRAPEPMCRKQHTELLMKYYKTLADSGTYGMLWFKYGSVTNGIVGDIAQVRHVDMLATQQLLDDPDIQARDLPPRAAHLLKDFCKFMKLARPEAPGFEDLNDVHNWAKNILQLKRKFMIGDKEYRVHSCLPGSKFDPKCMEAITTEGRPFKKQDAGTMRVALCLFPGIAWHPPQPLKADARIADALAKNKRFFPSYKEKQAFTPSMTIVKSYVLLM